MDCDTASTLAAAGVGIDESEGGKAKDVGDDCKRTERANWMTRSTEAPEKDE